MTRPSFAHLLLAALLPLSLGCDDPVGPLDLAGTYVLENADTGPLSPEDPPGTTRVLGDTIRLRFTGTGTRSFTFQHVDVDRSIELRSVRLQLDFGIDGELLHLTPHCPTDIPCLSVLVTYVAHRTATGFRMTSWDREGEELHYVKID